MKSYLSTITNQTNPIRVSMRSLSALSFLSLIIMLSCGSPAEQPVEQVVINPENFRVEPAKDWDEMLKRTSGWFAADGIFTIPLDGVDTDCENDKKILFLFSDTFVGEVVDGVPRPGFKMVNNSVAYLNGCHPDPSNITFHVHKDAQGQPATFFVPDNPNASEGQYYWLGDGFVNQAKGGTLYIFAYHVEMTGPNVFDFREPNVSLLAIDDPSQPPFSSTRQIVTPLHLNHPAFGEGNMGAGIYVNTDWANAPNPDGYVYIYGCIGDDKSLVVARVLAESIEDFNEYTFWNGEGWGSDINEMAALTNAVSNELSISPLPDGRYILTFQVMGLSELVGCRIGDSPIGPWSDIIELYTTPESDQGLFTYNAKAHPALSRPGELIISYNTITFDFWEDIKKDANIYRPRFIRLTFGE